MSANTSSAPSIQPRWKNLYAIVFGCFLGLALWKFGNPIILDHKVEPPHSLAEALDVSWPVDWGNWILGILGIGGLVAIKPSRALARAGIPPWLALSPLLWLGWQVVSSSSTVDAQLTHRTLPQLLLVVVCYFCGLSLIASKNWSQRLLPGLLVVFAFTLVRGANQHHFEFRRDYELLREGQATGWTNFTPDLIASLKQNELIIRTNGIDIANPMILEKLRRGRIHGTLVYPNAFAGAILLLLPITLTIVITGTHSLRTWLRWLVVALSCTLGIGCLYWTGSKSGWLIALGMGALGILMRARWSLRLKVVLASVTVIGGLLLFGFRFQQYFAAGATSVSARFDYWQAAVAVVKSKPLFGSGPGTFQRPYAELKAPESEMARLTHNDYLQQASDSGLPGALAYAAWIVGSLVYAGRKARSPVDFAAYLGVAGWFAQGLSEFSLYIPALAWPAFTLLGTLVGLPSPDDRLERPSTPSATTSHSTTP